MHEVTLFLPSVPWCAFVVKNSSMFWQISVSEKLNDVAMGDPGIFLTIRIKIINIEK
jgi:hypothetical protein